MLNLVFRQKAIYDISGIWEYTYNNWSEKQADKYIREIKEACEFISQSNETTKKYELIAPGLQGYKVNKHIIFYFKLNNEIEVIRILHQRMDLRSRLSEE